MHVLEQYARPCVRLRCRLTLIGRYLSAPPGRHSVYIGGGGGVSRHSIRVEQRRYSHNNNTTTWTALDGWGTNSISSANLTKTVPHRYSVFVFVFRRQRGAGT